MKKSNVIVMMALATLSVLLLGLWFALGFNHVDNPLDLVLTVCWAALIVGLVQGIRMAEARRCEALRTCYVGDGVLYNQESGMLTLDRGALVVDALQGVLSNLEYGFDRVAFPKENSSKLSVIVRTHEFADDGDVWSGEVAFAGRPDIAPLGFESKTELAWVLVGNMPEAEVLEPVEELPQDMSWRKI